MGSMSIRRDVRRLERLRTSGALSENEYEAAKARLDADAARSSAIRPRRTLTGALVLTLLVVAGSGYWFYRQRNIELAAARHAAEEAEQRAEEAEEEAEREAQEREEAEEEAAEAAAAEEEAERKRRERRRDRLAYERCKNANQGLLDALQYLDSRLDRGLSFSEYEGLLSNAQVEYDLSLSGHNTTSKCLGRVEVPAENSLNSYIDAFNIWNGCYSDSCEQAVQDHWRDASNHLYRARNGLAALEPRL